MAVTTSGDERGYTRQDWREQATISVPEAGRIAFDLSRNASYLAAARGDLPTIRSGGRLRVPVVQLRRLLGELP